MQAKAEAEPGEKSAVDAHLKTGKQRVIANWKQAKGRAGVGAHAGQQRRTSSMAEAERFWASSSTSVGQRVPN